jgi:hypothetical protein
VCADKSMHPVPACILIPHTLSLIPSSRPHNCATCAACAAAACASTSAPSLQGPQSAAHCTATTQHTW